MAWTSATPTAGHLAALAATAVSCNALPMTSMTQQQVRNGKIIHRWAGNSALPVLIDI